MHQDDRGALQGCSGLLRSLEALLVPQWNVLDWSSGVLPAAAVRGGAEAGSLECGVLCGGASLRGVSVEMESAFLYAQGRQWRGGDATGDVFVPWKRRSELQSLASN